jgi:hypothetical protein
MRYGAGSAKWTPQSKEERILLFKSRFLGQLAHWDHPIRAGVCLLSLVALIVNVRNLIFLLMIFVERRADVSVEERGPLGEGGGLW